MAFFNEQEIILSYDIILLVLKYEKLKERDHNENKYPHHNKESLDFIQT